MAIQKFQDMDQKLSGDPRLIILKERRWRAFQKIAKKRWYIYHYNLIYLFTFLQNKYNWLI
jgi:hypothetical protein